MMIEEGDVWWTMDGKLVSSDEDLAPVYCSAPGWTQVVARSGGFVLGVAVGLWLWSRLSRGRYG